MDKMSDVIASKGRDAAELVVDTARKTAEKAKDIAEIAALKNRIAICEDVKKKNFMEIGRIYYEQYGEAGETRFENQCKAIYNAEKGIEELQKEIENIKGQE